jgi:hypothetical protein
MFRRMTATATVSPITSSPEPLTLDGLAALDSASLGQVYEQGRVPASFSTLDGEPRGRMLASVGPLGRGRPAGAVRRLAASKVFPWAGKSFSSSSATEGAGINRVRLGKTREWFPFATRVENSAIDGKPTIVLDYDKPENPRVIRRIHDELREVAPGLFLGPAMWKAKDGKKLLLWFAIDKTAA